MRIKRIKIENFPPIRSVEIENLQRVTIIAGANGSGKTRIKEAITQAFRNPDNSEIELEIAPTREMERKHFNKGNLLVEKGQNPLFSSYMETRTKGGTYTGTVIQIDSNRYISPVKFEAISLATPDPDDQETNLKIYLEPFINRWPQTVNKIFQKAANWGYKLQQALQSEEGRNNPGQYTLDKYPNHFKQYQEAFTKLLPDKTLHDIDPKQLKEFQYKDSEERTLQFSNLSSGEQEAVKIIFDLLQKQISHSVFLIDEPELHLHPTLTFRLIETLKSLGNENQFIFFTHSSDLISTYYSSGIVYFLDPKEQEGNQAKNLKELDVNHPDLVSLVSSNLGIFSVGRQLVFIEGEESKIDRLTYHQIAQKYNPGLNFIPVGSVVNIALLSNVTKQLENSLFGINFYMIRDRDGLSEKQINKLEKSSNLKCLKRRHLENYFLDEEVISIVAKRLCVVNKDFYNKDFVVSTLKEIAKENTNIAFDALIKDHLETINKFQGIKVKGVANMDLDLVLKNILEQIEENRLKLNKAVDPKVLSPGYAKLKQELEESIDSDSFRIIFPGKILVRKLCSKMNISYDAFKEAYLEEALNRKEAVFSDIREIIEGFNK